MKIAINGVPKKDATHTKDIRDAIEKLLEDHFSTWKLSFEDSKGVSL